MFTHISTVNLSPLMRKEHTSVQSSFYLFPNWFFHSSYLFTPFGEVGDNFLAEGVADYTLFALITHFYNLR